MKLNHDKILTTCNLIIDYCIYASLCLVPVYFAFWQENFNIFELNKLLIFRSALLLAYLCLFVKYSLTRRLTYNFNLKIILPLTLLIVYILINTCFALNPAQSFFGNYMRQQGIHSFLYYWLWFLLLLLEWRSFKQLKSTLLAMICGLGLVLVYALIQKFGFDWLRWSEPGTARTFASLGQPNFLAYYLDLTIFLSLAYLVFLNKLWSKLLVCLLIFLQLLVLSFTSSRGGLLGLLAGFLVLFFCWLWRLKKFKLIITLISCLLCLLITSHFFASRLLASGAFSNPIAIRYLSSFANTGGSSQVRLFYWQAAWQEFQLSSWSRRLLGYGKDSQRDIYVKYYRPNWGLYEQLNSYPDRAHNLLIDIYLEFGLVGLLLFAYFNGLIILQALRFWLQASPLDQEARLIPYLLATVAAYFVSNFFGFPLTTHYLYYYFILALLWCLSSLRSEGVSVLPVSTIFCWLITAALTIFHGFFLWQFTYKYFIADNYFMKAKLAEARRDCPAIINNLNETIAWQPLDQYYQEKFLFMSNNCLPFLVAEDQKRVADNLLDHLALISEDDYNYDLLLNIAHSYSLFGKYFDKEYYQAARVFYQKLIVLNPYILSAYQDYGRMEIWAANYEAAKDILEQGIKASPATLANYDIGGYKTEIDRGVYYLWQLIGDADYQQKNFASALVSYHKIEGVGLVSLELYKNMADAYYQLKNYPQAEFYLRQNLVLAPDDSMTNLNLASFYSERGNLIEAKRFATRALELAPDNQVATKLLADMAKAKK